MQVRPDLKQDACHALQACSGAAPVEIGQFPQLLLRQVGDMNAHQGRQRARELPLCISLEALEHFIENPVRLAAFHQHDYGPLTRTPVRQSMRIFDAVGMAEIPPDVVHGEIVAAAGRERGVLQRKRLCRYRAHFIVKRVGLTGRDGPDALVCERDALPTKKWDLGELAPRS